jgi:hypothetical protein
MGKFWILGSLKYNSLASLNICCTSYTITTQHDNQKQIFLVLHIYDKLFTEIYIFCLTLACSALHLDMQMMFVYCTLHVTNQFFININIQISNLGPVGWDMPFIFTICTTCSTDCISLFVYRVTTTKAVMTKKNTVHHTTQKSHKNKKENNSVKTTTQAL